jgi:hypothetical protein
MSEQPEALRKADLLVEYLGADHPAVRAISAELRRLHTLNGELLEALKLVRDRFFPVDQPERDRDSMWEPVNAAIAKVEGKV